MKPQIIVVVISNYSSSSSKPQIIVVISVSLSLYFAEEKIRDIKPFRKRK